MILNQKVTGRASSIPGGLVIAGVVSMITTVIIVVIGAILISREIMSQDHIGYCVMLALLAGATAGSATAAGKIKHRKALVTMLSGVVYYLVLLLVTALFFGGQYRGMGVTLLVIICGSILGLILVNRKRDDGVRRRHKKYHC